jgi:nitrile hydratase accessory protein
VSGPAAPEAPFAEPWQAQAFALAVTLNEAGLFTWPEWAEAFGRRRAVAGGDYWRDWLATLEEMVSARAGIPPDRLAETADDWARAAEATPHGTPITLDVLAERSGEQR